MAGLSQFLVTLAMALNGYVFGQHWTLASRMDIQVVSLGFSVSQLTWPDGLVVCFSLSCWLGVILASVWAHDQRELVLACVFAPVGALTRWYLSFSNTRFPHFPLGTLVANLFGTLILAVLSLVQTRQILSYSCPFVQALMDGYCGCLTTVSTLIVS